MALLVDIVAHANGFLENGTFVPREICLAAVERKYDRYPHMDWCSTMRYRDFTVARSHPIETSEPTERALNEYKERKFHRLPSDCRDGGGQIHENYVVRRVKNIYSEFGGGKLGVIGREQFDFFSKVCGIPHVVDIKDDVPRFREVKSGVERWHFFDEVYEKDKLRCLHKNADGFCSTEIACCVARYVLDYGIPEKEDKFFEDDECDEICRFYLRHVPEGELGGDDDWYYRYFDDDELMEIFENTIDLGILL